MMCWIDLETSGLDEKRTYAFVLEVAVVITTDDLENIAWMTTPVVPPHDWIQAMEDAARKMHENSGLLAVAQAEGRIREQVDHDISQFIERHFHEEKPVMAGSSVGFDRLWLQAHMPRTFNRFHYRNADVSSVREFAQRWWPELKEPTIPDDEKAHRALDDIFQSIKLAKFYREHLGLRSGVTFL